MKNGLLEAGAASKRALKVSPRGEREIVLTRTFPAPRELVWTALSRPEHIRRWWGQRGDTMTVCEMDFRAGGAWRFMVSGSQGEHGFGGQYREIAPALRIVQTFEWDGMSGHISLETLSLDERGGQTTMTIHCLFDTREDRDGMLASNMEEGAGQSYDRLEELLEQLSLAPTGGKAQDETAPELVLSRLLDAPRELVWQAWTEREHLVRWAPQGFTIPFCEGDLRVGGAWRTCMVSPDGKEHWVGGQYREVMPVERLAFTHLWDNNDGHPNPETLVTITLAEQGAKTQLHFHQTGFASLAARDGHEIGWSESLDRLNDLLNEVQTAKR